ncbi:MAG: sigma-54 dependent transcriptional regulator [Verrucomicrobiota bacterium]|nr:sigma-54 dependent transcriptional regulator [Verrucomicrobiota bacterium]
MSAECEDYSRMRVVVVDDDPMILDALKSALSEFGFNVLVFHDPSTALDWMKENGVDIVISDIYMPGFDGFHVLKEAKSIDPQCDVIFITAHAQLDIAVRALREGATDFFEKPFTVPILKAAMERTRRFRILSRQNRLLTDQLHALSSQLVSQNDLRNVMLGHAPAMKRIAEQIVDVADSTATVMIVGESGTGKELVARAIHFAGARRQCPFLVVNCPSIPEELFESEMFGHRKGAFTGAVEAREGYVKAAQGGTLFLDEIGDLPLKSQAKILRLLEQRVYLPIGEHTERLANARVVAATNQALDALVRDKKFREDLYYRMRVCAIAVPPLRERREDIPMLALYFALRFAADMGKPIDGIDEQAMTALCALDYPGNVRELRNLIESSIIHCRHSGKLSPQDLPSFATAGPASPPPAAQAWPIEALRFHDVEKRLYQEALSRAGNNVSAASRLLGLSRGKLRRRLADLKLKADSA